MKNGYAILKACMEDQTDSVNALFAQEMASKVSAVYDSVHDAVGRAIGRGEAINYDALVNEGLSGGIDGGVEYANPGEVPPTDSEAEDLVGIEGALLGQKGGNAPLGGTGQTTVKMPPVGPAGVPGGVQ